MILLSDIIKETQNGAEIYYRPVQSPKGAVIICAGGAYVWLNPREEWPVAACYEKAGWQPFILHYSVGYENAPLLTTPMKQLAWAMTKVRAMLPGVFTAVCGFSAGGNVCACLGVHWNDAELFADSSLQSKVRPDGMILAYSAVDVDTISDEALSAVLVGDEKSKCRYFSPVEYVNGGTPPAFLWHTAEDEMVPASDSVKFAKRMMENDRPVELHVFPYGVHGLSIATPEVDDFPKGRHADPHVATWMQESIQWLNEMAEGYKNKR